MAPCPLYNLSFMFLGNFFLKIIFMLFNHSIKASFNANCVQYEHTAQTPILTLKWSKRISPLKEIDITTAQGDESSISDEPDLPYCLNPFKDNVLHYISGFICRRIKASITCKDCLLSIINSAPVSIDDQGHSSISL